MAKMLRFAPALAPLLGEAALQLSGYQNVPLAILLAVLAVVLLIGSAWSLRPGRKRHRDSGPDPVDLLRAQYKKGRELQHSLVWPRDGIPTNSGHAAEQARRARRVVCSWAKSAWRDINEHFQAYESEFYGPGDRALGASFFFMSCEQEIDEAGGQPDLYLERKLEFIAKLLRQFKSKKTTQDSPLGFGESGAQERLQSGLGDLMHEGSGYASQLAALRERGINDFTIVEASDLAWVIDAWLDEGFEWVRREKAELVGLLTPVPTPTQTRAIDVLPPLVERRGTELRDVFYRL